MEIGSWMGKSVSFLAVEAVNSGKRLRIVAVDNWEDHRTVTSGEEFDGDETYERYLKNIEPVADRIETMRTTSLDAADTFEDASCDFVFIDASHDYEDVLDDLRAWYPKVKAGGLFAGHDYHWPGVSRAVHDFAAELGIKRPRMTELCWAMEVGGESRSAGQRLEDAIRAPLERTYGAIGRGRYELMVRRRQAGRTRG